MSFLNSPGAQVLLSICQSSLCVWLWDVQGCSGNFKDRGGEWGYSILAGTTSPQHYYFRHC